MRILLSFAFMLTMPLWAAEPQPAPKADLVIVEKSLHQLSLYREGKLLARFHIALGGNPQGHKQREGDQRTPEGRYTLDSKNAQSAYYKAIHISYPNAQDKARAKALGVSPGGAIMIHGQKNGWAWAEAATQRTDWTLGCIALRNEDMDKLWRAIDVPVVIEIKP